MTSLISVLSLICLLACMGLFRCTKQFSEGRATKVGHDSSVVGTETKLFKEEGMALTDGVKSKLLDKPDLEQHEDLISGLPDHLLLHILSFLDMKQVIATASLSKRWRFLWLSASSLIFHYKGDRERTPWFIDYVATTLMLNNAKTLDKFSIKLDDWECRTNCITTVNTWIRYATLKSVQELHLDLSGSRYQLPLSLYKNEIVKILSFKGCKFNPPTDISWGSLKMLTVTGCNPMTRDIIRIILKGSPRIVCLDMIDCFDPSRGRRVDYHYDFRSA